MQHHWPLPVAVVALFAFAPVLHAQQTPHPVTQPSGSNWGRVEALPHYTKVHVTADHGGKTCRIFAVTDDTLTCSKSSDTGGVVFQRTDIKQIKLAHYVRSALVGAGIGGGAGAIVGAIAGRSKPCPTGGGLCLNGIGIGAGGVAAIFGVGGAVVGGVAGGLTDMTRGSSIYTRP